jgi:hypothetical protein
MSGRHIRSLPGPRSHPGASKRDGVAGPQLRTHPAWEGPTLDAVHPDKFQPKPSLTDFRTADAAQNTGDRMSDQPTRDEITAHLAAVEARTDAKIAQAIGEVRTGFATLDGRFVTISSRLDGLERTASGAKTTTIVTGIAVVGVLVAILAYGQTWFGIGVASRDTIKAAVVEAIQQQGVPTKK